MMRFCVYEQGVHAMNRDYIQIFVSGERGKYRCETSIVYNRMAGGGWEDRIPSGLISDDRIALGKLLAYIDKKHPNILHFSKEEKSDPSIIDLKKEKVYPAANSDEERLEKLTCLFRYDVPKGDEWAYQNGNAADIYYDREQKKFYMNIWAKKDPGEALVVSLKPISLRSMLDKAEIAAPDIYEAYKDMNV